MQVLHAPITSIHSLTEAELFADCAARIFRATHEESSRGCACLARIFAAAQLASGLPVFLHLQIALSMDAHQALTYEALSARHIGSGERGLLQALFSWQQVRTHDPQDALWFLPGRAIRRVAAEAGRQFASQMAACGLVLPGRDSHGQHAWPPMRLMTTSVIGAQRTH